MIKYSRAELIAMRLDCDASLMYFTRLFFHELRGQKFGVGPHHEAICSALDDVFAYKTRFLNINIPPRHSNRVGTKRYCPKPWAESQRKQPLHNRLRWVEVWGIYTLSGYSFIRIIQALYGVTLKKDQQSKNVWRTNAGGGLKTATIFDRLPVLVPVRWNQKMFRNTYQR